MARSSLVACGAIALALVAGACHRSKPPQVAAVPAVNQDSIDRARRDSLDRIAAARRDSMARAAREDSLRRAADAERAAAAARASLVAAIYFDYDRSALRPEAAAALDAKVPVLQANSSIRIRIEGHTDERGSDEYNLALAQRRAAEAKRYLVDRGIDAGRIEIVSFGEERPVCTEQEESCWSRNRRAEFRIAAGTVVAAQP